MTQNTYTVITSDGAVKVEGLSASSDRDALIIYTDAEREQVAAVFRRWDHVTVERPEEEPPAAKFGVREWPKVMAAVFGEDSDERFTNMIEWDKELAATVDDPKVTALLIERAARTGFNAGMDAAVKAFRRGYADGQQDARLAGR